MTNDNNLLKSVSRSIFASIQALPATVRPSVGVAYLLCRTADTLVDTDLIEHKEKQSKLMQFRDLFNVFPPSAEAAKNFDQSLQTLTFPDTPEGKLIQSFSKTYESYSHLSRTDQAMINDVVRSVTEGMIMDMTIFHSPTVLSALTAEVELEQYLLLIGGEPGRFWSRVTLEHLPHLPIADRAAWIHSGISLGKGLQLINILRDLPRDLKIGRCYIPIQKLRNYHLEPSDLLDQGQTAAVLPLFHSLIDQSLSYLEEGMIYLNMLPLSEFRLRAAAWWPLIIGVQTLAALRSHKDILNPEIVIKIPRKQVTYELLSAWIKLPIPLFLKKEFQYWKRWAQSKD